MPKATITISLPDEMVNTLDIVRGDVPRSAWIRRAVGERLERESSADKELGLGQRAPKRRRARTRDAA